MGSRKATDPVGGRINDGDGVAMRGGGAAVRRTRPYDKDKHSIIPDSRFHVTPLCQ